MFRMLVPLAVFAAICGCQAPPLPVYHPELKRPLFTRVNLRSEDGVHLRSSNILSQSNTVPLASRAEILQFTDQKVDIMINKVEHTMYPDHGTFDTSDPGVETFLEKYFVSSQAALDLATLGPPELADSVRQGNVLKGMTKEQLYAALGPPQWIDTDRPTTTLSRAAILRSDRWVYTESFFGNLVPKKEAYLFEGNKLQEMKK